jgi:hypothetical protein
LRPSNVRTLCSIVSATSSGVKPASATEQAPDTVRRPTQVAGRRRLGRRDGDAEEIWKAGSFRGRSDLFHSRSGW